MYKAETPVLWPPHAKSWLIGKDSDVGRDRGQEEMGMTENEMAGWYRRLDGRQFLWSPGVFGGQGGLVCCSSWVAKSRTWLSEWTELDGEYMPLCMCVKSLQLCLTLCDTMNCSLPGSSVHGILHARILEWVAMPSSMRSSPPKDLTLVSYVSCIVRQVLYHYATWNATCHHRSAQTHRTYITKNGL